VAIVSVKVCPMIRGHAGGQLQWVASGTVLRNVGHRPAPLPRLARGHARSRTSPGAAPGQHCPGGHLSSARSSSPRRAPGWPGWSTRSARSS